MSFILYHGDCLEQLKRLEDDSIDSIVTDPPYGLSFMGKKWDYDVPSGEVWAECLRVLKPGGHLLAFAGTRTQHRMAVRIEDAGFEIRDMIAWVYGSGFPKSLDVSKAIDKAAGAEREKVRKPCAATAYSSNAGNLRPWMERAREQGFTEVDGAEPATAAAAEWQGWGTALKPALEPITVARKPLVGTVAENVQRHGTGAINVDGCRAVAEKATGWGGSGSALYDGGLSRDGGNARPVSGRWPANLIHDGSDEVVGCFPESKGTANGGSPERTSKNSEAYWGEGGGGFKGGRSTVAHGDTGSAARFFYCAKASKRDRDEGLEGFTPAKTNDGRKVDADNAYQRGATLRANVHPTVKPTDLMRYLCRLVTPPGGVVLDPFMGSGSTGKGAMLEGFQFVGIEREAEYLEIAKARIEAAMTPKDLFSCN